MSEYGLTDPCGNYTIKIQILAVFIKSIINGESIKNKNNIRSATVKGYANEINTLHTLRNLDPPIVFADKNNQLATLINNLERQEDIAKQRKPLTKQMAAEIIKRGKNANFTSKESLLRNTAIVARKIGPRAAEFTQKTAKKPDYHEYQSGKRLIKSICANWLTFRNKRGSKIKNPAKSRASVHSVALKWKFQKNRRNGEELLYTRDYQNPDLCMVDSCIDLYERASILGQDPDLPLFVYEDKDGSMRYLTANTTTKYLQMIAKAVHPDLTTFELSYYSCHSLRVWAAVLLNEAGEDGDVIRIQLRWLSDAYRVYLRNTENRADMHNKALQTNSNDIMFELTRGDLAEVNDTDVVIDDETLDTLDDD